MALLDYSLAKQHMKQILTTNFWILVSSVLRVCLALLLVLLLSLAWNAHRNASATGAGAAQADLGFMFLLLPVSLGVIALIVISLVVSTKEQMLGSTRIIWSHVTTALSLTCGAALVYNWVFLIFFWA